MPFSRSTLSRLTLVLLAAGLLQRLIRYALAFPVWGDEAFICLNVLDRSPAALAGPLRFDQAAPVLFLWAEWAVLHLLGPSELALRLPSLLAGLAALLLFARLARLVLSPSAAVAAVGILAVSYYPVRHSCEIKPYAFDLLMTLLLLVPAAAWLRRPARTGSLVLLLVLVPVALAASYPALFTAGAVSLALLPAVCRQKKAATWLLFLTYNVLLAASFGVLFLLIGREQHASMVQGSAGYWDATFPPFAPLPLARWLIEAHTSNLFAYPLGGRAGGSLLTFLAFVLGAAVLARMGRRPFLVLLIAPFLLNFFAAALGKYPYGGSARVAQHLAPAICLLAGLGLTALIRRAASGPGRRMMVSALVGLLLLFALGGVIRDVRKPYKTLGDEQARQLVREIERRESHIIICAAPPRLYPSCEWYLRLIDERVTWVDELDQLAGPNVERFWCLRFVTNADARPDPPPAVQQYRLTGRESFALDLGGEDDALRSCEVWEYKSEIRNPN